MTSTQAGAPSRKGWSRCQHCAIHAPAFMISRVQIPAPAPTLPVPHEPLPSSACEDRLPAPALASTPPPHQTLVHKPPPVHDVAALHGRDARRRQERHGPAPDHAEHAQRAEGADHARGAGRRLRHRVGHHPDQHLDQRAEEGLVPAPRPQRPHPPARRQHPEPAAARARVERRAAVPAGALRQGR